MRLAHILASLTEQEALHAYNALAQWADNERNGLEQTDPEERSAEHEAQLVAVESLVTRLETELVRIAG